MSSKTSRIALIILIAAAIILGLLFVNKGDGPVMKLYFSDKSVSNIEEFDKEITGEATGLYFIMENNYNKFRKTDKSRIPLGKNLYANIYFTECPKGSEFTAKWIFEGNKIKEETLALSTDQHGVISYLLEDNLQKSGDYELELYYADKLILKYDFSIK